MSVANLFIQNSCYFLKEEYLQKISRCLNELTEEQVWWRNSENLNSIGNLLLHLEGNIRQWIISGVGGETDYRQRQSEFDERKPIPKNEVFDKLSITVQKACAVLQSLSNDDLQVVRTIQGHEVVVLYAIFHAVEHFSMHTGQIIYLTKYLTTAPLEFYSFKDGIPKKNW